MSDIVFDFSDITPIPLQANPGGDMCAIAYSQEYKDTTDLYRGILSTSDRSERFLALNEKVIALCPANYTIWSDRLRALGQIILAQNSSSTERAKVELKLMDSLCSENMKNYQVWHHRKMVLCRFMPFTVTISSSDSVSSISPDSLDLFKSELEFTARILSADSKNYHTWAYRQWLLLCFCPQKLVLKTEKQVSSESDTRHEQTLLEIFKSELDYTAKLLVEDVRNNSVWNHRFFILFEANWLPQHKIIDALSDGSISHTTQTSTAVPFKNTINSDLQTSELQLKAQKGEISFAKASICQAPANAAAWNYLRGVTSFLEGNLSTLQTFSQQFCSEKNDLYPNASLPSPLALECLADAHIDQGNAALALPLLQTLQQVDPIRIKYWALRMSEITAE